jgi:hypothetical protein
MQALATADMGKIAIETNEVEANLDSNSDCRND